MPIVSVTVGLLLGLFLLIAAPLAALSWAVSDLTGADSAPALCCAICLAAAASAICRLAAGPSNQPTWKREVEPA